MCQLKDAHRLESWVKGTSRLAPTVVTPKLYKNRLRNASEEYFLLAPDKWTSSDALLKPKDGQRTKETEDFNSIRGQVPLDVKEVKGKS